jgi:tRNA nucleotidyltransferase (CCA-adding enzyme)
MPDYMYSLESRLSIEQRAALQRVQELANAGGLNVYLVGGAVRDLVSGMPIRDLDFALEGNPSRLAREIEKSGGRIVEEDEHLRHVEMLMPGDVDVSLAAARDDVYIRPGTKPELRWATIMEDLRRRDFSMNAIAISLNPASRGLLLDPTNGLADIEKQEVRALSIHSFTNQPVRMMRLVRFCARMSFKMETRTADWFALAKERDMHENIPPDDVGAELRQLTREEKPASILKAWENHGLIAAIHPQLARRHPHYDMVQRLMRAREDMIAAGFRPRLLIPGLNAFLGRLKSRERASALGKLGFRSAEVHAVLHLENDTKKTVKILAGRKTAAPRDAFNFLEKLPRDTMAYILAEFSNSKVRGKIRNYLAKWHPMRENLPAAVLELESLGMPHGPKFDLVIEKFFDQQLMGKGKMPEDRIKLLRKLSGIKEPPKKKEKEEKKKPAAKEIKKKGGKAEAQEGSTSATPAAAKPPTTPAAAHAREKTSERQAKASKPRPTAKKRAPAKHPAARKVARKTRAVKKNKKKKRR